MDNFQGIGEFVRTVESKSFVKAAQSLGMTASGVSKAVARLEARLGLQLLTRTTRSLGLTHEGQRFHARCLQLLADFDDARTEATSATGQAAGTVRLELPTALGTLVVAPALPEFLARYPSVAVEVTLSERLADLAADGIDIALRLGALPDSGLIATPAGRFELITCASPRYLKARGVPSTPANLRQHACLQFFFVQTGRPLDWVFQKGSRREVIQTHGALRMNHGEALVAATIAGAGIAHLPGFLVHQAVQSGQLVRLLPDWQSPGAPLSIVSPAGRHLLPKVRVLREFLTVLLRDAPELALGKIGDQTLSA
jgi:LysR family transcriptional regulator, regulator for bpeEF and oprC